MATEPSENQRRNLELAGAGLEAWVSGRREQTLETLADDVEVFVPPELGNPGTYHGKEEFLRWNGEWDEAWSDFQMSVGRFAAVGDSHVVAEVHSRGTGRGSGIEVENVLGWVIGIRDGFCDYVSLQPSLEDARRVAEERETAS